MINFSSMATMGKLYKNCDELFDKFGARGVVDSVFASKLVDFFYQVCIEGTIRWWCRRSGNL